MTKKLFISFLLILSFLFLFCSCEKKYEKTNTSILTSFKIEGVEEAGKVIITAREKESGSETLQRTSILHIFDIFIKKANFFAKVLDKNRKSGIL